QANELKKKLGLVPPKGIDPRRRIRIFGGGALVFDEYGQLKYQIANRLENTKRQQTRLDYLGGKGFFDEPLPPSPPPGSQSQVGPPSGPPSDFGQLPPSRPRGYENDIAQAPPRAT